MDATMKKGRVYHGSGSGIGAGTTKRPCGPVTASSRPEETSTMRDAYRKRERAPRVRPADVADEHRQTRPSREAVRRFGRIDVLSTMPATASSAN